MSCVTYLSFADLADTRFHLPDEDPFRRRELFSRYPLTRYASANWRGHAQGTENALAVDTVLSFLSKPNNVIRADRLGPRDNLLRDSPSEHLSLQHSALHIAAMYGLHYVTQKLLDEGSPAESRDFYGRTPLYLAAMLGEQRVVEILVARNDVNVNTQTNLPWLWYVFSESIFPLLIEILSLETCLKSLYSRNMFQCSTYTPQIGNTDCEFVI